MDRSIIKSESLELMDKIIVLELDSGTDWNSLKDIFQEKTFRAALKKSGSYRRAEPLINIPYQWIFEYLKGKDRPITRHDNFKEIGHVSI